MMKPTRLAAVLLAVFLASCASYTLVGPGRTALDGGMSVEPGVAWNRASSRLQGGATERWTMDGPLLDSLTILDGVGDGTPLSLLTGDAGKAALFRSTMTASDVMELVEASLSGGAHTAVVTTRDLRPVKLGAVDGFRFEGSYIAADAPEMAFSAVGAVRGGKLYLLFYRAARIYYFNAHLADFDRLVGSVRLSAG
jgi:hypothetical protein